MKVIAINGSPQQDGNTQRALSIAARELTAMGIEVEYIHLGNCTACTGCYTCARTRDGTCALPDDGINACVAKLRDADGLILGSPVYYSGMTGALKGALDRIFTLNGNCGDFLRHKVGAVVVVARRTGAVTTFDSLMHYLVYAEMVILSGRGWDGVYGRAPGEVDQDPEGLHNLITLGKNMGWLLAALQHSAVAEPPPPREKKVFTSFVR